MHTPRHACPGRRMHTPRHACPGRRMHTPRHACLGKRMHTPAMVRSARDNMHAQESACTRAHTYPAIARHAWPVARYARQGSAGNRV
eukprot:359869-Chlamydomonas_euryale.AAC.30